MATNLPSSSQSTRWYLAAGAGILAVAGIVAIIVMRPRGKPEAPARSSSPAASALPDAPQVAPTATLWLAVPEGEVLKVGEEHMVEVRLDTRGMRVNAVRAVVEYDPDTLEVVGLDGSGSSFPMEVAPKNALTPGRAEIVRFITNNAFAGEGLLVRLRIQPRIAGPLSLRISEKDSQYSLYGGSSAQRFADIQEGMFTAVE